MMTGIRSLLSAPFNVTDVEFRVGATTGDKKRGMALVYADTRAYQNRLDDVFGPAGWSCSVDLQSDTTAIATVTVHFADSDSWVSRQATGTDTDPMSAEARAFKRACSALGVGRYLYDSPSPWAPVVKRGKNYVFDDEVQDKLRTGFQKWQNGLHGTPTDQTFPSAQRAIEESQGKQDTTSTEPAGESTPALAGDRPDWRGPADAQQWAIQVGACKDQHEAIGSWVKQVDEAWPGTKAVKPEQLIAVFDTFYTRQIEKLQEANGSTP